LWGFFEGDEGVAVSDGEEAADIIGWFVSGGEYLNFIEFSDLGLLFRNFGVI
jgi:hypothetical protein